MERTAAEPEVCASTNSAESVCASSKVSDGLALRALHAHCVFVTAASDQMLEPVIGPATALRRLIMSRLLCFRLGIRKVLGICETIWSSLAAWTTGA